MAEFLIFIVSALILCVLLMMVPKNVARQNGTVWLIITVITMICCWVFFAGIMNFMGIRINLYALSGINAVVSILAAVYVIRKKKTQKYYIDWKDILILCILALITLLTGKIRYGMHLDVFAYASDDSSRHFAYARNLVETGRITQAKYVMYLIDMVFIKCMDPFIGFFNWHRAFMIADMFLWFMMGAMFWAWIRRFIEGKYSLIAGYGFTFVYFLGYPLLNLLYGFEYLGAGILMINFLLWIIQKMDFDELLDWMSIGLLMLANTSVCLSYTQFAPAVFVGEAIYFILFFKKRKKLVSLEALAVLILGMAVPGALCISYVASRYWEKFLPVILLAAVGIVLLVLVILAVLCFQAGHEKKKLSRVWRQDIEMLARRKWLKIVLGSIVTVVVIIVAYRYVFQGMIVQFATKDQGMVLDGSIYREPYSNFLILMFPMILYIVDCIKKKQNDAVLWMSLCTVVFSGWILYCVLQGSIGSYYFYKMHFLFWLFLFCCAFRKTVCAKGEERRVITIYLLSAMALFLVFLTGREQSLIEHDDWLWEDNVSGKLFGVYQQNMEMLEGGGNVNHDMQTIYNKVAEIVEREDTFVPYFGEELRYLKEYYYHLTNQDPDRHPEELNSDDYPSYDIRKDLEDLGIKYIFVQKNYNGPYEEYQSEFNVMWTEFENDYGWILKLD